jgi:hypothetical protein
MFPHTAINEVLVTEGKLVLVQCNSEDGLLYKYLSDPIRLTDFKYGAGRKYFKPIIISETEKIVRGDSWYDFDEDDIWTDGVNVDLHTVNLQPLRFKKILALPEHFTKEQLKMIVDGYLKEDEVILLECEQESPIPMDYKGVDSRGDYIYYCPKCGWGGSYMGTGQVHCYKDSCRDNFIKHDSNKHCIIHKVQEKMYPLNFIRYITGFSVPDIEERYVKWHNEHRKHD